MPSDEDNSTNALRRSKTDRIIIAVDLDYFYAQVEEIRNPKIKDKPVVICVYSGRTSESGAVSTANYIARKLGVRSGIPIVNAKSILKDHAEAVFLPTDKDYYDSISSKIMEILRQDADSFEQVSVDEAFLDVTERSGRDYATATEIALKIKEEIKNTEELTCSVGVSKNKLLAKMSADSKKPDGLTVIEPDRVRDFLEDLPVSKLLGIGPKTEEKLDSLGVKKIGELARTDELALAKEFGKNQGPRLKLMAQGIDDDPVVEKEAEQLSRIITLKHDALSFDFIEEIRALTKDLSNRLKFQRLKCRSIGIIEITSELKIRNRVSTLNEKVTDEENEILKTATDLFRRFFEENEGVKVRRVGIRLSGLVKEKKSRVESTTTLTDYMPSN